MALCGILGGTFLNYLSKTYSLKISLTEKLSKHAYKKINHRLHNLIFKPTNKYLQATKKFVDISKNNPFLSLIFIDLPNFGIISFRKRKRESQTIYITKGALELIEYLINFFNTIHPMLSAILIQEIIEHEMYELNLGGTHMHEQVVKENPTVILSRVLKIAQHFNLIKKNQPNLGIVFKKQEKKKNKEKKKKKEIEKEKEKEKEKEMEKEMEKEIEIEIEKESNLLEEIVQQEEIVYGFESFQKICLETFGDFIDQTNHEFKIFQGIARLYHLKNDMPTTGIAIWGDGLPGTKIHCEYRKDGTRKETFYNQISKTQIDVRRSETYTPGGMLKKIVSDFFVITSRYNRYNKLLSKKTQIVYKGKKLEKVIKFNIKERWICFYETGKSGRLIFVKKRPNGKDKQWYVTYKQGTVIREKHGSSKYEGCLVKKTIFGNGDIKKEIIKNKKVIRIEKFNNEKKYKEFFERNSLIRTEELDENKRLIKSTDFIIGKDLIIERFYDKKVRKIKKIVTHKALLFNSLKKMCEWEYDKHTNKLVNKKVFQDFDFWGKPRNGFLYVDEKIQNIIRKYNNDTFTDTILKKDK
ncbi:transcription elongation factor a [Anaeramoeba flamelloides]|uniref:Transcription elongation factor a n=1 Tax=Anaeramoeba flamelloides TaxID=1746091 RepID=A0ABQ8Z2A9_9EUKA|nr:transcription elongation factor a [Anaeramoeba flamelloides]